MLGLGCGSIVGLAAFVWKGAIGVGLVLTLAITVAMITACLLGVLMPTALRAMKADPKIAAGPIVLALDRSGDAAVLLQPGGYPVGVSPLPRPSWLTDAHFAAWAGLASVPRLGATPAGSGAVHRRGPRAPPAGSRRRRRQGRRGWPRGAAGMGRIAARLARRGAAARSRSAAGPPGTDPRSHSARNRQGAAARLRGSRRRRQRAALLRRARAGLAGAVAPPGRDSAADQDDLRDLTGRAWSPSSSRGTTRSTCSSPTSRRRWSAATRSSRCPTSRRRSRRCGPSRCWREAGVPDAILQVVTGVGAELGPVLIDQADAVLFTGSTATGRIVAAQAAARLVPASVELGGKNALLVLDDADLDAAADGIVAWLLRRRRPGVPVVRAALSGPARPRRAGPSSGRADARAPPVVRL